MFDITKSDDRGATTPSLGEIEDAAVHLSAIVARVPLFESERLNRKIAGRLLIKAETLQPTGSFKVRGAWNRLRRRSEHESKKGVLALSSGNHGIAVAWAARAFNIERVVVLMPDDAPTTKVETTRELGAEVVFYDRLEADRAALVKWWEENAGLTYIPAFDDRDVIAGAATVALEVTLSLSERDSQIDDFVVACSGGGLVAGSLLALRQLGSKARVWAVEPEAYDDTACSLDAGKRVSIRPTERTICDALTSLSPGEITFGITRAGVAGVIRASDDAARLGMRAAFAEFGLVAEPSGALALGAILSGGIPLKGNTVVVVLSGRNVDRQTFNEQLSLSGTEILT